MILKLENILNIEAQIENNIILINNYKNIKKLFISLLI